MRHWQTLFWYLVVLTAGLSSAILAPQIAISQTREAEVVRRAEEAAEKAQLAAQIARREASKARAAKAEALRAADLAFEVPNRRRVSERCGREVCIYEGQLRNGEPEGYGTLVNSELSITGRFHDGEFIVGTVRGENINVAGRWGDGKPGGIAAASYEDGSYYYGEVDVDEPLGYGVLSIVESGKEAHTTEGQFEDGKRNGYGIISITQPDENRGDRYEGSFSENVYDGYGVYYYADGSRNYAFWIDGKPDLDRLVSLEAETTFGDQSSAVSAIDPEIIIRIQRGLTLLNYDVGPVDGVIGEQTRQAIIAFQNDTKLPATGRPTAELALAIEAVAYGVAAAADASQSGTLRIAGTGSGFLIDSAGYFLTNFHVVENCREIRVQPSENSVLIKSDPQNDLALIKSEAVGSLGASLSSTTARLGDETIVAGYPLSGILSSDLNVTTGSISALSGLNDDSRFYQVTNPIQPGNSGGPLLDKSGHVIGVVSAKLNELKLAESTGVFPQNVGFAVRTSVVQAFLDTTPASYHVSTSSSDSKFTTADIAEAARQFTARVECWR